jgi:hypothetical protein
LSSDQQEAVKVDPAGVIAHMRDRVAGDAELIAVLRQRVTELETALRSMSSVPTPSAPATAGKPPARTETGPETPQR